ncbi:hypothetical protein LCGC14_2754900, partial [marine sediment metagenome]
MGRHERHLDAEGIGGSCMSQESFIVIPVGMDCRRPGQKAPTRSSVVPQDWQD